jgi:serine/threonine protein kinase
MEFVAGVPLNLLIAELRRGGQRLVHGSNVRRIVAEHLELRGRGEAIEWNEAFFKRSWIEMALGIVRDLARALHHAHQRGVLHRDVKAANVILSPTGRVKLLDFGLASLSDAQSITRSGAQIGSLPYMSPEQIDGETRNIAATADVYSLGVLLFELLTLTLPYKGATYEELRRKVLDARLPPLRALNPAVSAATGTVCEKALDPDRARRYAGAADFADDLENLLEVTPE